MKNWLYIPFLILMSVTYSRVVENFNSDGTFQEIAKGRAPASLLMEKKEVKVKEDCLDLSSKLNPHFKPSAKCEL